MTGSVRFGTDGIRGPANTHPITAEVARRVGRAACRLADQGAVVVAHDPRPSSPELAEAVAAGVVAQGGVALRAGLAPTAAVGVVLAGGHAASGVMVTASHNAAPDNGFKVFGAGGDKLDDAACRRVESWIADPGPAPRPGSHQGVASQVRTAWLQALGTALPDLAALQGRRVAIDLAAGAAKVASSWLRDRLPCELHLLGEDGEVNAGCGSEHLGALATVVRREGLDGGFAVDGDADRCRLVDGSGRPVPGDAVAWRLARSRGAAGLAVTVMSNGAIEAGLPDVVVHRTPVGDRHLRIAMRAHGLPLGAEESGHVLFDDYPAGDGLLTGLRTLTACFEAAPTLAGAFEGFRLLPRQLTKVRVGRRPPLDEVTALVDARRTWLAKLGPHGRVFLRYSGTEPVLRLLVEGSDAAEVDAASEALTRLAAEVLQ